MPGPGSTASCAARVGRPTPEILRRSEARRAGFSHGEMVGDPGREAIPMARPVADIEAIFFEARQKQGQERVAYLDEVCGDDQLLRRRLEQFLQAQAEIGSFLNAPAPEFVATVDVPSVTEQAGTVIGPYKLLEQIGEGGFGVVFMAEQQQPVRRKVALKVLKPGMDTRQVVARFEAERQALALMDHPNIARVFDGGATV